MRHTLFKYFYPLRNNWRSSKQAIQNQNLTLFQNLQWKFCSDKSTKEYEVIFRKLPKGNFSPPCGVLKQALVQAILQRIERSEKSEKKKKFFFIAPSEFMIKQKKQDRLYTFSFIPLSLLGKNQFQFGRGTQTCFFPIVHCKHLD